MRHKSDIVRQHPVQVRSLADEQIWQLHAASLEILHGAGVRFYAGEAVDLLRKAGAPVSE